MDANQEILAAANRILAGDYQYWDGNSTHKPESDARLLAKAVKAVEVWREADTIRIPLDGPPPTEPGTFIGELNHPLYTEVAMYQLAESDLEHLKEAYPNARWSRRIEIGGA